MRWVLLFLVVLCVLFVCVACASPSEDILKRLEALEQRVRALEELLQPGVPGPVVSEKVVFEGKGQLNTEPFRVKGAWLLEWESSDEYFTLIVSSVDGSRFPETVSGASKGRSFFPRGGVYYLSVIARGEWKVTISEYGKQ